MVHDLSIVPFLTPCAPWTYKEMSKDKQEILGPLLSRIAEARKGAQSYCKVAVVFLYCAIKFLANCTIWLTSAVLMHKAQSTVVAASFNFGVARSNPTPGISKGPTSSVQHVGTRWRRGSKEVGFGKIKIPHSEAKRCNRREKATK